MWSTSEHFVVLAILVHLLSVSFAIKYKAIPVDDEIFSDCSNQPKSVLNINGLYDLSTMNFNVELDRIIISGNTTIIWDIMPADRIQVTFQVFKLDRGVWEPTVMSIKVPDFCPIMYDKNQYWYKAVFIHITNINEIRNLCLNVVGTVVIVEPFDLQMLFDSLTNMDGGCKCVVTIKAFDLWNKARPTSICFEIKGEAIRV